MNAIATAQRITLTQFRQELSKEVAKNPYWPRHGTSLIEKRLAAGPIEVDSVLDLSDHKVRLGPEDRLWIASREWVGLLSPVAARMAAICLARRVVLAEKESPDELHDFIQKSLHGVSEKGDVNYTGSYWDMLSSRDLARYWEDEGQPDIWAACQITYIATSGEPYRSLWEAGKIAMNCLDPEEVLEIIQGAV